MENTNSNSVKNRLDVGGTLATEWAVKFRINKDRPEKGRPLSLITKEFVQLTAESVKEIATVYQLAKKEGLNAPRARYFKSDSYYRDRLSVRHSIIMHDVTKSGQKRIWGYNDHSKKEEKEELIAMKLTESDIAQIDFLSKEQMKIATQNGRTLIPFNYHILMDRETNDIEIAILDLDTRYLKSPNVGDNESNQIEFMNLLSLNLEND